MFMCKMECYNNIQLLELRHFVWPQTATFAIGCARFPESSSCGTCRVAVEVAEVRIFVNIVPEQKKYLFKNFH